jgi:hypothetical protein
MKVTVAYYNWDVLIYDNELIFKCTLNLGTAHRKFVRAYDIPKNTRDILFEMPYIRIEHGDKLTQFKCDGDSYIIGDVFQDGERIDEIAVYDFWDEWED